MDFHYEVNGEMYDFSIPGGGFTTLENVVKELGIDTSYRTSTGETVKLGTKEFVSKVESVGFSNPALVYVSKVEKDTTIGEIKNSRGLECEYSAELSEDEIAEINGSVVEAGDWAIISLRAFSSNEKLTVRMVNGNEFVVRVTDAVGFRNTYTQNDKKAGYAYTGSGTNTRVSENDPIEGYASGTGEVALSSNTWKTMGYDETKSQWINGANQGYTFVWWIADKEISLDGNTWIEAGTPVLQNSIKPYSKELTNFKAYFKKTDSNLVMYKSDVGGEVNKDYSYSTDVEGATATPAENYAFLGWYDQSGNLVCATKTFDLSKATTDMIVTAKYQAPVTIKYVVEQIDDNGSKGNGTLDHTVETVSIYANAIGSKATPSSGSYFAYWKDDEGNIVSYDEEFIPTGAQIKNTTYKAYFANSSKDRVFFTVSDADLADIIDTRHSNKVVTNVRDGFYTGDTRYEVSDKNGTILSGNKNTDNNSELIEVVRWEKNGNEYIQTGTPTTGFKGRVYVNEKGKYDIQNGDTLMAIVKPKNTFIVNYECTTGGTINNTTDYAGSDTAKGATATANVGEGYKFLGWYIGDRRVSTKETITAQDLIDWKIAGYIKEDFTTITAKFGSGYHITYKESIDGNETDLWDETISTGTPAGYEAEEKVGYNFIGWFKSVDGTETNVSEDRSLTSTEIGNVNTDLVFVAKYETAYVATYKVVNEGAVVRDDQVISQYGEIALGSTKIDSEGHQTAGEGSKLKQSVVALPLPGCEFVEWLVTDAEGNEITIDGFNPNYSSIPANLEIDRNVVFTAKFKKSSSSIELVYNIQQDQDRHAYGASLTVDGKTVYGTADKTAYISEVVPAGGSAKGCAAAGITLNGDDYEITGWVLGENNESNKDKLFTLFSTFTPSGEYLDDVNGNGVRFFRVLPKWNQNVYVQLIVSPDAGGDFYQGSSKKTNDLIFINNRYRKEMVDENGNQRTDDEGNKLYTNTDGTGSYTSGGEPDNFRNVIKGVSILVSEGYKLTSFSFNGVEYELAESAVVIGDGTRKNLTQTSTKLKKSYTVTSIITGAEVTVDNLLDLVYHTTAFRNVDGTVKRSINILQANFDKINSYNIKYVIRSGEGLLSNNSDTFTDADKTAYSEGGSLPIAGSTASGNTDLSYVFDHWEWEDEEGSKDLETGDVITRVSKDAKLTPNITKLTDSEKTYYYYAVFVQKTKINIRYIPEDEMYGTTIPDHETVFEGGIANGSDVAAFDGWRFSHWTREGSDEHVSEDSNFVPQIYDGNTARANDNVTQSDFDQIDNTVTFVAHFTSDYEGSITVEKSVVLKDGLTKDDIIGTKIYFALTKDGRKQDYLKKSGKIWTESITITEIADDGNVSGKATFTNLPSGNYEVWELADVDGALVKQYVGMVVAENVQVNKIGATNTSDGDGNNAILTDDDNSQTVYFTNTYAAKSATTQFDVRKEWQDVNKNQLTGSSIPTGAEVEITVYQEVNGTTKAFRSITLDGTPDVDGETEAWHATFENLPTTDDSGNIIKYKARETIEWPGYEPYINSGKTYLYENLYMEDSGGTIVNRAIEENETLITIMKVDANDGTALAGAQFLLQKKDADEFAPYDDGEHHDGYYSVSSENLDKGTFTVSLPDGTYLLTETIAPDHYRKLSDAQTIQFTVSNTGITTTAASTLAEVTGKTITIKNQKLSSLTITKSVTGGMGDPNEEFRFTLSLPSGSYGEYSYKKYSTTDGTNWTEITGEGGTLTSSAPTFTLKHNQKVVIENLPMDTNITVTEANGNYTTTWSGVKEATGGSSGTFQITDDATLSVTNNLEPVSPTGIHFNMKPFLFMLFAGLGLLLLRRRKRGDVD